MAVREVFSTSTGLIDSKVEFLGPYRKDEISSFYRPEFSRNGKYAVYLVPCRKCTNCRKLRSLDSATRCELHLKDFSKCSFLTLTYRQSSMATTPQGLGTLFYPHFQTFMKDYRSYLSRRSLPRVGFFMCGEYGAKLSRPHYHAIIFGHCFDDLVPLKRLEHGHPIFKSAELSKLWKHGFSSIGEANVASARYVASYIHKKILGARADDWYSGRTPEFVQSSKRPAIGLDWLKKFAESDVLPYDELVLNGVRRPIPAYFNRKMKELFPSQMEKLCNARKERGFERLDEVLNSGLSHVLELRREGKFAEIVQHNLNRRPYESDSEGI